MRQIRRRVTPREGRWQAFRILCQRRKREFHGNPTCTTTRRESGLDWSPILGWTSPAGDLLDCLASRHPFCRMSMNDSNPPTPKGRWYQYSLRTLIAVTLVSCVAFGGWLQFRRDRAAENRERVTAVEKAIGKAVAEIEEMGGYVESEHKQLRPQTWLEELFDDPGASDDPVGVLHVSSVDLRLSDVTDDGLEHLRVLTHLKRLNLDGAPTVIDPGGPYFDDVPDIYSFFTTNVTDAGLEHLKDLTNLEDLNLTGAKVTDAGLKHLKKLTNLQDLDLTATKATNAGLKHLKGLTRLVVLNLDGTKVSDPGLEQLKELTNLKKLALRDTNVTDAGLEHVKGLTNLKELNLWSTNVTDAGLLHLKGLTKLKTLHLYGTKVSDEGVKKLPKALPNCWISHKE